MIVQEKIFDERVAPSVSIIILNWNGWRDTVECLESVYQIDYPNYYVIIVDNGSENESLVKIKDFCLGKIQNPSSLFKYLLDNKPVKVLEYTRQDAESGGGTEDLISYLPSDKRLILIKNEKNYGFSEGNNIAMRYALNALNSEYFLLLNNDTTVDRQFLKELVKFAIIDDTTGLVGPKIIDYQSKKIQSVGGKISLFNLRTPFISIGYGECDNNQYNQIKTRDWLLGCCLLIPTYAIKNVGFFNADLFAYCEDVDLSIRMKKNNYKNFYCPTAVIWHKGGASGGGIMSDFAFYLHTRNKITIVRTYYNFLARSLFLMYTYLIYPIFVVEYCLVRNNFRLIKPLYYGLKDCLTKRNISPIEFLEKNKK